MTKSPKRAVARDGAAALHPTAAVADPSDMPHGLTVIPWDDLLDDMALYAWQPALRFALDCERASERCDRRNCKLSGRCQIKVRQGKPFDCGAGISDEVLIGACRHVAFGCEMLLRFCDDYELAAILIAPEDSPQEKSSVRRRKRSDA